jgi:hypothetical protein
MPKLILDKFTTMPISRQRRYQMRRQQEGRCKLCAEPAARGKLLCAAHERAAAEHMRSKRSPAWEMI